MNIFKPHSITFPGPVNIFQINSWTPTPGFNTFEEFASSGVTPIFNGTHDLTPTVDFETPDIDAILSLLDATYKVFAGFTGFTTLSYLKKTNLGINGALDAAEHSQISIARSQLTFESMSVQQSALATISCKLKGINASNGSGTLDVADDADDLATPSAVNHYTLGPVAINSTTICATGLSVANNIQHDTQFCSGGPNPEYTAIDRIAPTVTIQTNDVANVLAFFSSPAALTAFSFFLRRKTVGQINVANATTSHLKFTATVGSAHATGDKEIVLRLRQSLAVAAAQAIA
jgi:hypothetical protein